MQTIHLYKDAAYNHVGGTVIMNVTNLNGFRKWTANAKKEKFNDFTILCNCQ